MKKYSSSTGIYTKRWSKQSSGLRTDNPREEEEEKRKKDLLNMISGDVVGVIGCHHGVHLHQVLLHTLFLYMWMYTYITNYQQYCCSLSISLSHQVINGSNSGAEGGKVVRIYDQSSLSRSLSSLYICVCVYPLSLSISLDHKTRAGGERLWRSTVFG